MQSVHAPDREQVGIFGPLDAGNVLVGFGADVHFGGFLTR